MLALEPSLGLAVAHLLAPERFHRWSSVMPYDRRRAEADPVAQIEKAPADVYVVGGLGEDGVEPADFLERPLAEGHVATRDVLGRLVVEHDLRGSARRAVDALGHPRVFGRHQVRAADADHVRLEKGRIQVREPIGISPSVRVDVGDDLARRGFPSRVPGGADAHVRRGDRTERVSSDDGLTVVGGAVVDDDDLVVAVLQFQQRPEAIVQGPGAIVGGDDHRDFGGATVGRERHAGGEPTTGDVVRGFGPACGVHETEPPLLDEAAVLEERIGPPEDHRSGKPVIEGLFDLPVDELGLSIPSMAEAAHPELRQDEGPFTGEVLEPRKIYAEVAPSMEVHVERGDVDEGKLQMLGRREVRVRHEGCGVLVFGGVAQFPNELLDLFRAVPADDGGRDLLPNAEH